VRAKHARAALVWTELADQEEHRAIERAARFAKAG
jgi:hypothetical protein